MLAEGGGGPAGATPQWGRATGALGTLRPGVERRSAGAPRRLAMTHTGHANQRQLPGEPIAVDVP